MAIGRNDEKRGGVLADKIQRLRQKKGLSQERLAALVGVSVETIRKIEQKSTTSPGVFLVLDIAKALGVDIKKLIVGK
jgi:transcriptional regulator with XRE-family HTH domain